MTDHRFTQIMYAFSDKIRADTPIDTGNLRRTATRGKPSGNGKFEITVVARIAPYFHYVNDIKEVFDIALTNEKVASPIELNVKTEKKAE